MGTKRKVALWYERRRGEYVVLPPNWKPKDDGSIVFTDRGQMLAFARASRLVLRQVGLEGSNGKPV